MVVFGGVSSSRALCSVLFSSCIKFSASPFALGCNGVIRWCLKPSSAASPHTPLKVNAGPLSDSSCSGVPYVANTFLSFSFLWV